MYAINDDKSFFNLGAWAVMQCERTDFVPGITLSDATLASKLKNKFVKTRSVSGFPIAVAICQGITEPCPWWDVIHHDVSTGYFGPVNLTEDEQEDAAVIENVFFSNDNIYIVASEQPINRVYVRFKGA